MGILGESPDRGVSATLEELHIRLDQHYRGLRTKTDLNGAGRPIFALEHGLVGGELSVLSDAVRSWVRTRAPSTRFWLPFVAYAAEIGYRYVGDDYWPTLEASTPGWERHADRHYVSRKFNDYAKTYGGAVPKGRWASHFTIICWPITHAVLPTDLQRQLARVLYDYRGALTADILAQPTALGTLAAHAAYASKRFQQFAENTELLGQVAVALLAGSEDDAPCCSTALSFESSRTSPVSGRHGDGCWTQSRARIACDCAAWRRPACQSQRQSRHRPRRSRARPRRSPSRFISQLVQRVERIGA